MPNIKDWIHYEALKYRKKYWNYLRNHGKSDLLEWEMTKDYYYTRTGKRFRYHQCHKDINEKLMWITRYWQHPLKTLCADKYLVRDYLKQHHLENIAVPLLGVWDKAEDINFDNLPNQFVLKCNHGSHFNIICLDKSQLNIEETRNQLNSWLSIDFASKYHEIHYRNIPRKIICERLLSQSAPLEFQFWCLNGEPDSILVCRKNFDGTYESWSYSTTWEQLFERKGELPSDISYPEELPTLVSYAKKLSEPFPFVRADFYLVCHTIYLAELTFTPNANLLSAYNTDAIIRMGNKLHLPPKYKPTIE